MKHIAVEPQVECSTADNRMPVLYPVSTNSGKDIPDEELVERTLGGDEDAFRHLYEKYRRPVIVAVGRILPDPEEARDATQEIFMTSIRKKP